MKKILVLIIAMFFINTYSHNMKNLKITSNTFNFNLKHCCLSFAITPDNKKFAVAQSNRTIALRPFEEPQTSIILKGSSALNKHLAFNPQGETFVSASYEKIVLWNSLTDEFCILFSREKIFSDEWNKVCFIAFDSKGNLFALILKGSPSNLELWKWNGTTGEHLGTTKIAEVEYSERSFYTALLSPSKKYVVIIEDNLDGNGDDKFLKVYSVSTKKLCRCFSINLHLTNNSQIVISPNEQFIAFFGNNFFKVLDVQTNKIKKLCFKKKGYCTAFNPDGKLLAAAFESEKHSSVILWNTQTWDQVIEITYVKAFDGDYVNNLVFTSDGKCLISSRFFGNIKTWKLDYSETDNYVLQQFQNK